MQIVYISKRRFSNLKCRRNFKRPSIKREEYQVENGNRNLTLVNNGKVTLKKNIYIQKNKKMLQYNL